MVGGTFSVKRRGQIQEVEEDAGSAAISRVGVADFGGVCHQTHDCHCWVVGGFGVLDSGVELVDEGGGLVLLAEDLPKQRHLSNGVLVGAQVSIVHCDEGGVRRCFLHLFRVVAVAVAVDDDGGLGSNDLVEVRFGVASSVEDGFVLGPAVVR